MSSIEQTAVTGAPLSKLVPKRGQKIAGRYIVNDRLYRDPFSTGFLGRDEETDTSVLVRIARVELLDRDAREVTCAKLREAIGIGGRYFSPLLDADLDGPFVFTVEHVPSGASLRRVLKLRKKTQRTIRPRELLPVIARLSAALVSIPPPFCHGDVRAENIWIDPERLMLTGGFLASSLPKEVIASVVNSEDRFRARFAPEVTRGAPSDASDRYNVASIVYEALVGDLVDPDAPKVPARLGAVADYLEDLLRTDSHRRARTLDPLIKAIAAQAGLPVPDLDAGSFRTARKPRRVREPQTSNARSTKPSSTESADASTAEASASASTDSSQSRTNSDSIDTLVLPGAEKIRAAVRVPRGRVKREKTVPDGSREALTSVLGKLDEDPTPDEEGTTRIDMEELAAERARREARAAAGQGDTAQGDTAQGDTAQGEPERDEEGTVRMDRASIEAERAARQEKKRRDQVSALTSAIEGADQAGTQQISFDELKKMTERSRRSDAPPRPVADGAEDGTQQVRLEDLEAMALDANRESKAAAEPELGRVIEGAAVGGTQELSVDDFEQMLLDKRSGQAVDRPARKRRQSDDGSLDPRFVRAALASVEEQDVPPDPTEVASGEVSAAISLPPPYNPEGDSAELRPQLAAIARARDAAKAKYTDGPEEDDSPTQIRALDEIKPVPKPQLDPSVPLRTGVDAEVLFDDSAIELGRPRQREDLPPTVEVPLDEMAALQEPARVEKKAPPQERAPERRRELGDTYDDEVGRRAAAVRRGRLGWKIILFAVLLGLAIVGGALIYVQAKRSDADRELIRQQYQSQPQGSTTR